MTLHSVKEEALLAWINGFHLDEPVQRITDLQDGCLLLKFVYKLKGQEPNQVSVNLSQEERLSFISNFIHNVCQVEQCVPLSWHSTSQGNKLDLELAKIVLVLCYYGLINNRVMPDTVFDTELQMASMFRFIQHEETGFSLREGLDKLLSTSSIINSFSSSSVSSYSDDGSPFFNRSRSGPRVTFLDLDTVASSSFVGSPIQEIINTPQVQLRRLRKELAHEGDVRDELEQELTERIATISEKEGQISQLQHRLQRLLRDQEELEKDHKTTLAELQQRNEGLLQRVHEVLKQCQDLKTDNTQKDKKIDELMEENGTLSAQVRNAFAQLARAEEEVTKLTEAHESSQAEWGNKRDSLERELSQALSDREDLSEQIQILQGKISVMEDELSKVSVQLQEKGEVLGPIMEWEKMKQELADLMLQLSHLEETISGLKNEKIAVEKVLSEERGAFERETKRLEGVISDLQQSINNIREERAAQEQAFKEKHKIFMDHIADLESKLARLQQLELQLTEEISVSAELRKQRGELEAKIASLEDMVNNLRAKCQSMEMQNESQQQALDALRTDLQNAQISLSEYEGKLAIHQKVVEENNSLRSRISALDDTVALLQSEINTEKKRGEEILAAKDQQRSQMEEKFQQQEQKAQEMFAELGFLSEELRKIKRQKLDAEVYIEKLTEEGKMLTDTYSEERDQARSQLDFIKKAKDETELEFQRAVVEHHNKMSKLQCDIEETTESLKQSESQLFSLKDKISSKDEELLIQQQKVAQLQYEADGLKTQLLEEEGKSQQLSKDVSSKVLEVQGLKGELELKEEEIRCLKANVNLIEAKYNEMCGLHQRETEEHKFAVSELKQQLAEAEKQISEKHNSLEELSQQLHNLKEELSMDRQRVATLESNLDASKKSHETQEQTLKLEIAQLQDLADGHLKNFEELLLDNTSLNEEISCQRDIVLQREQEASVLGAKNKTLEENFAQLQEKLTVATALATERQSELLVLQEKVELQEKAMEMEETCCQKLESQVNELNAQVSDLNNLVAEKETLLGSLHEKMKEQKDINQKHLEKSEEALQRELENVGQLKEQLNDAVRWTTAKNELLESTEGKLKQMELLCQQKETVLLETSKAREALEGTIAELCTKQQLEVDRYQQELVMVNKEKEHLSSVNQALQDECQSLQAEKNEKQNLINGLEIDFQKSRDGYQKELETIKKEKEDLSTVNESLLNDCQRLTEDHESKKEVLSDLQNTLNNCQQKWETTQREKENLASWNQSLQNERQKLQEDSKQIQDALTSVKAELQNNQNEYQLQLETMIKEKEHLSSLTQSLQNKCQSLQEENKGKENALGALKSELQSAQNEYQQEIETIKKEKEHLSSVNESLQNECQSLQTVKNEKEEALNALSADLQNTQDRYSQEINMLKKEKENLSSVNQSLQNECQSLQKSQEGHKQELESLKKEKEHLLSANQSVKNECQHLQEENKGQLEALKAIETDLQNIQNRSQQEIETIKKEKEDLSSVNESLQNECQSLQTVKNEKEEALNALSADLQNSQDRYSQDINMLKKEKENLSSVNQSLQNECQSLQKSQEGHKQELESLKKEKEHLLSANQSVKNECQHLQEENKGQLEALKAIETDLQNIHNRSQQELYALKKEMEQLSAVNESLQNGCQSLQKEKNEKEEALNSIIADLQNTRDEYQQEMKTLKEESEHLSSVNQSLQNECQSLQKENKEQLDAITVIKTDLQNIQNKKQLELDALKTENENLLLAKQTFEKECQSLKAENNQEKEELDCLKTDLQNTLDTTRRLEAEMVSVKEAAKQREMELENRVEELQVKIKELSTLVAQQEVDIKDLHQEVRRQETSVVVAQELEKTVRAELETQATQLHLQTLEASELASRVEECERQKQDDCQTKEVLERKVCELAIKRKQDLKEAHQELEAVKKEKDELLTTSQSLEKKFQDFRAENKTLQKALDDLQNTQNGSQQEMEAVKKEKERLTLMNQLLHRQYDASQKLRAKLEAKLGGSEEALQTLKDVAQQREKQNHELQEQLKQKNEAVEHYKVQVEKAKTHYNGKKQQLVEEQEARQALQASLATSEIEVKALKAELKLASAELENTKASEKNLTIKINSLEIQLDYADRQLRELVKNPGPGAPAKHRESVYLKLPKELPTTNTDILELDLDDSLNAVSSKASVPGESSTPLVRSSERLAAKRRAQERGSLETLYFTPMNPRGRNRDAVAEHCKLESSITSLGELTLDSTKKLTSSAIRRRTTQVINITMTRKSPGYAAEDKEETFYSLHTAQSQPNLAFQKTGPVSMEIFGDAGEASSSDKLLGLPGYRRSNVHSNAPPRATSTFCVGAEYEPEHVAGDWMRIAELQARNKACLPHLKSSYPLESRPSLGFSTLPFSDEDVRTGDPNETIRRASLAPSQLTDSLSSHRLSLLPSTSAQPQRYSMLPGQISAGTAAHRASQLSRATAQMHESRFTRSPLATKRPAGQLQDSDTPEAKKLASCFPRPVTPKSRNLRSTSSNCQNKPPSPANRRQSMAFVIDNTPKKKVDSRLQRGINKLRNSARKSPAAASSISRSSSSPQVSRGQRKSPRVKNTKSPKIPTSAQKVKFRMKI